MIGGLGIGELVIILVIVLLIFGPNKLGDVGSAIGRGISGFKRAMKEIKPDLWITNLRKGQTKFRDNIDIVSESNKGLLKISPFYYWSDLELEDYMDENNLENEFDYFDPTKVDEKRECGLHNQGDKK